MSAQKPASWAYAEEFVAESEVVEQARHRGEEFGCTPVGPGPVPRCGCSPPPSGARAVAEVGTGAGVSGLWLLAGMPEDGILTTIDVEAEHQRAAREAYAAAGVAHQRTRVITGRALDVLPRMTDGAYDMVVIDADKLELPRLRRAGGAAAALRRRPGDRQHALARQGRRPGGAGRRPPGRCATSASRCATTTRSSRPAPRRRRPARRPSSAEPAAGTRTGELRPRAGAPGPRTRRSPHHQR